MTIGKQLAVIQGISVFAIVLVAAGGIWGLSQLQTALSTGAVQSSNIALRNAMTADMMHDALRADALNALLSTAAKGRPGLATLEDVQTDLKEHAGIFEESLAKMAALDLPESVRAAQRDVEPALAAYIESARKLVALGESSPDKAFEAFPPFVQAFDELEGRNEKWSGLIEETATEANRAALTLSSRAMLLIGVSFVVALIGGCLCSFLVCRSLKRRLTEVQTELQATSEAARHSGDDVQRIAHNVFEASTEQAAAVQETVASMAEMSSMIAQTNENAKKSLERANQVAEKSEEGTHTMNRMVESMQ